MTSVEQLLQAAQALPVERKAVRSVADSGEFQREFSPEFPFEITRIRYPASQPNRALWHTYLEIFVLLSAACRRQMGSALIQLSRGDILVMDHVKLHRVADFPGPEAEAIVIRFRPELVRSPGAAAADHTLLLPFYCHPGDQPNLLRASEPAAPELHGALIRLLGSYADQSHADYWRTGSRGHFLVLLHLLARRFHAAERLKALFAAQQARNGRLQTVFEHIGRHYAGPLSLPAMAAKAGLSRQRFNVLFKQAAGMTLVDYVTHVRLTNASRLLQETDRSIAEIASAMGFADQSYFDRRFRRHFGRTPLQFRRGAAEAPAGDGKIVRKN